MKLTYGQLERVLTSHLAIHPDRVSTFRSRVKQLQRLGFPSGVNVGRGEKMAYTGEHLFKMVTVFELLGMGLTAQFATSIVEEHWHAFKAGYALCQRIKQRHAFNERIFARLILRTLSDIQFTDYAFRDKRTQVTIEDKEHFSSMILRRRDRTAYVYPVFVLSELYDSIVLRAVKEAGLGAIDRDDEVTSWLPTKHENYLAFEGIYPDRGAIEIRKQLHSIFGNDPDLATEGSNDLDDTPF